MVMMIQKSPNIIYGGYHIYKHWDDWDDWDDDPNDNY